MEPASELYGAHTASVENILHQHLPSDPGVFRLKSVYVQITGPLEDH